MASETISFRCRGELKDWLESFADERMLTVSMAAQQIIAEKYREENSSSQENDTREVERHQEPREEHSEPQDEERSERQNTTVEEPEEEPEPEPDPVEQVLELHDDKWRTTREGSKNKYAIVEGDNPPRYYKSRRGVAARLAHDYGSEGIDINLGPIKGGNYSG